MPDLNAAVPVATPSAPSAAPTPSAPETSTPSSGGADSGNPAAEPTATPTPSGDGPAPAGGTPDTPTDGEPARIGREPQQKDFPGDPESFLKALYAWERGEKVELPAEAAPLDGEKPADDVKPGDNPADDDAITVLDDEPEGFATPQALQEAIEATPGLKDVLDANPQVKNKFAAMARQNAKLQPLGEIFPSKEAAEFANETANKFVGLRTGIMSASTPEEMAGAFQSFTDEFKIVDAEGNPVLDAQGNPMYGEDFDLFMSTAVTGSLTSRMDQLKADIEAGKYTTEEAKENASMRLSAIEFVLEQLGENADDAVTREDLDALPENIRKQIEAREAAVKAEEERLGIKKAANKKEEVKAARVAAEGRYRESYGKSIASQIQTFLDEQTNSGAYMPTVVMQYMVDNGHGQKVPIFGKNVLDVYKARIKANPYYQAKLAEYQMLPPTPENEKKRSDYTNEIIAAELPGIMRTELRKIQQQEKTDRENRRKTVQDGRKDARVEPHTDAGAPIETRTAMSDEESYAKAKEQVERDFPNLNPEQKLAKTLELRGKLQRQGR